MCELILADIW